MHDEPDLAESAAVMLRLLAGWACVALGLLDLAMGVDLDDPGYLAFHLVLLVAGAVLLGWGKIDRRPRSYGWIAGVAVACAGLVASTVGGGFPFDPDRRPVPNVIFWILTGLIVTLLVPGRRRPAGPLRPTHAERRATPAPSEQPDEENVGGLP